MGSMRAKPRVKASMSLHRLHLKCFVCACLVFVTSGIPLARHTVDMTYTFDESTQYFPNVLKYRIKILFENENSEDPEHPWLQSDEIYTSTHAGTHMDAPRHFDKIGKTMEQLDITKFIAPAAVIDITNKARLDPDATVSVQDLQNWERVTGFRLDQHIVLMRSGWGKKWGNRTAYYGTTVFDDPAELHNPGISGEAARWLVNNRKAYGVGVDTLSLDKGPATDYPAHIALLGHGLFGLENIANMERIPICGATLHVMPMKVGGGSGAPVRIIATFPRVLVPSLIYED